MKYTSFELWSIRLDAQFCARFGWLLISSVWLETYSMCMYYLDFKLLLAMLHLPVIASLSYLWWDLFKNLMFCEKNGIDWRKEIEEQDVSHLLN